MVELATLSRSGLVGLAVGFVVLLVHYRGELLSRAIVVPLALVAAFLAWVVARREDFFLEVIRSRFATGDTSTSAHFGVYEFIPNVLSVHPFFGLGLNNFSVYYEFVTGKDNWGPHSFYVALLVETGLVGTMLFGAFVVWMFRRLRAARFTRGAARVGPDGGARGHDGRERVLPHDVVLLLLRARALRACPAGGDQWSSSRRCVTTSGRGTSARCSAASTATGSR